MFLHVKQLLPSVNFTNFFGSKSEQLLCKKTVMLVNATAFGKKASNYVAHTKAVAYTRVEHLKSASLRQAPALPENITLG